MNDKIKKLEIYVKQLQERLTSPVPTKHKHRPEAFKEYLIWEISCTQRKIDTLRLAK